MLAETPQLIDGEVLVFLLVLLVAMLLATVAVFALGCLWAWKAGRGSQPALVGWILVASLEAFALLLGVLSLLDGTVNLFLTAPLGALAVQAALYAVARDKERGGG